MTVQQLVDKFTAANLPAYLDAAPAGISRYIAVSPYGVNAINGDNENLCEIERIQLDICSLTRADSIVSAVKSVLISEFILWETVTPLRYDPEFKLYRAILQLELY